jgi:hypothetical protein
MKIACGIAGYGFKYDGLDLLVSLYELVIEKQGDADLRMLSQIETSVKERAEIKKRSELLDKVSEKV